MSAEPLPQDAVPKQIEFSNLGRTRVQVVFDEPELSSDGGALLLREVARTNGIIPAMAAAIHDPRRQDHIDHALEELLTQRTVQICHGYEDANDCDRLKNDAALKVAVGRSPAAEPLASQPTMTRLENSVTRRDLIRLFYVLVDTFLDSYPKAPDCMLIDLDPTANRVYGDQQMAFFNAHYDDYCFMPFHVYEGLTGRLITTVLRPGKTPTKEEIIGLLKRIVRRIRTRFPDTTVIVRADSHHTKPEVLDWLENHGVRYVLGLAINPVLARQAKPLLDQVARIQFEEWTPFRAFHSFEYAAKTWSRPRRVVARVEATARGTDTRFIVTDLGPRASPLHVRAAVLWSWERRADDQGTQELPEVLAHQLYAGRSEPVPAVPALRRLRDHARPARDPVAGHRDGYRNVRHHPSATAEGSDPGGDW